MTLTLPRAPAEFRINGVPHWKAKPYLAKLGETQLWIVKNDTNGTIHFTSTVSPSSWWMKKTSLCAR